MEVLHHEATNTKALITALDNGEIRVYNEKHLVSVIQTNVRNYSLKHINLYICVGYSYRNAIWSFW
jgi:hypothetical protein